LNTNAARREELRATLVAADEPAPSCTLEWPTCRQKITTLAQGLEHPETRTEACEAVQGFVDAIVPTPNQGEPQIELKGIWQRERTIHVHRFWISQQLAYKG
jgi:hypothetical protein